MSGKYGASRLRRHSIKHKDPLPSVSSTSFGVAEKLNMERLSKCCAPHDGSRTQWAVLHCSEASYKQGGQFVAGAKRASGKTGAQRPACVHAPARQSAA